MAVYTGVLVDCNRVTSRLFPYLASQGIDLSKVFQVMSNDRCLAGRFSVIEESLHVTASLGNVERNDWTIHDFNGSFLDVSVIGWVPLLSGNPIFMNVIRNDLWSFN